MTEEPAINVQLIEINCLNYRFKVLSDPLIIPQRSYQFFSLLCVITTEKNNYRVNKYIGKNRPNQSIKCVRSSGE